MSRQLINQIAPRKNAPRARAEARLLQRKCDCGQHTIAGGSCEPCRKGRLQRRAGGLADERSAPPIVREVLQSGGQPLDAQTRAFMESRFHEDFSQVRVHTDEMAAQSARGVNASAYTVGQHVVFARGEYAPSTREGRRTLAHELTHVVQQRSFNTQAPQYELEVGPEDDVFEREAEATASAVVSGGEGQTGLHDARARAPKPALQRITLKGVLSSIPVLGILVEPLSRLFGGGTFDDKELKAYLERLVKDKKIEGNYDSDNKAREIVARWDGGVAGYNVDEGYKSEERSLPGVELKRLLIQEMLNGITGGDDERAIITIFRKSSSADAKELLNPTLGLSLQDLESDVGGDNWKELLKVLNEKLPDIGEPQVKRSETPGAKSGACTVGRAIKLNYAHQRAGEIVKQAIQLLDEFIAKPQESRSLEQSLKCFFNNPNKTQVARIRSDFEAVSNTLPSIKYTCPAEPFEGFTVKSKDGVTTLEPEPDIQALSVIEGRAPDAAEDKKGKGDEAKPETFNVLLFPPFFDLGPKTQTRMVIHEAFHLAKRQAKPKESYEPSCRQLSTDVALENADSFAQFAMSLEQLGPTVAFEGCPEAWKPVIVTATRTAEKWIGNAIAKVDAMLADPQSAPSFMVDQLRKHFKIGPDAKKELKVMRDTYADIQAGFGGVPIECDFGCSETDKSVEVGSTPGALLGIIITAGNIHLCRYWFEKLTPEVQAESVAHEMAHRFGGKRGDVRRKEMPHEYGALSTKEALGNADSFAQFAKIIYNMAASREEK